MASSIIKVLEHGWLAVGDRGGLFGRRHFEALARFNERHDNRFFVLGHERIKFNQYVGVLSVGSLVIEVLPKVDGLKDEEKWQRALIQMLKVAHDLPLYGAGHAHLALLRTSVLEYFLRLYVEEVRRLVRQGLVKRYRKQSAVSRALKGRLDLPRHMIGSATHRERFHVVHQVYDADHLLHAILKRALHVVEHVTTDPLTTGLAKDVQWAFDGVTNRPVGPVELDRVHLDRKTKAYGDALILAKLILLNYTPDVRGGSDHILSLLFDMNKLFELVVLRLLMKCARDSHPDLVVSGQASKPFWNGRPLRPDILISRGGSVECIIDTKWKTPKDDYPAMGDLRQVYVYNRQYDCDHGVLLYPGGRAGIPRIDFEPEPGDATAHGCSVRYLRLFDEAGNVDPEPVADLLATLISNA